MRSVLFHRHRPSWHVTKLLYGTKLFVTAAAFKTKTAFLPSRVLIWWEWDSAHSVHLHRTWEEDKEISWKSGWLMEHISRGGRYLGYLVLPRR